MLRLLTPFRLTVAAAVVAALAFALYWVPSDSYIFLPNRAHPVAPLVEVRGGKDPTGPGGIYFVDVLLRKATLVERLWPGIRDGATVVPADLVRPEGQTDEERRRGELAEMERSQEVAAAVALRELGYEVVADPAGARVEYVDPEAPAADALEIGDVVVGAEGRATEVPGALRRVITGGRVGRDVTLTIRRDGKRRRVTVKTIRGPEGRPVVGVIVSQAAEIELPIEVDIDVDGVGGPSAGLAFALHVLEELGRDVDRGNRVAVTGTIELDGTVGEIGGIKQKTIGVERAGIDVFVVPAGDNAREARRHADEVRVVAVETFQQALRALATLRQTAQN